MTKVTAHIVDKQRNCFAKSLIKADHTFCRESQCSLLVLLELWFGEEGMIPEEEGLVFETPVDNILKEGDTEGPEKAEEG